MSMRAAKRRHYRAWKVEPRVLFPAPAGDWGTITYVIGYRLATRKVIRSTDVLVNFPAGALSFTLE